MYKYECNECGHESDDYNDGFCPSCDTPYNEVFEDDEADDFDNEEDFDDEHSTSEDNDNPITHYLEP